jgi:hypothetical protein
MVDRKEGSGIRTRRVYPVAKAWTYEEILLHCLEEGECLVWFGPLNKGVPYIRHEGRQVSLRPFVYVNLWGKRLLGGYQVVPSCGNPKCLARECLVARTHSKINTERAERWESDPGYMRRKRAVAKRAGISKLDDERAAQIRADDRPAKEIAAEQGVHQATIHRIKRGTTWAGPKVANSVFNLAASMGVV